MNVPKDDKLVDRVCDAHAYFDKRKAHHRASTDLEVGR